MNIELSCDYFTTSRNTSGQMVLTAENVHLSQTVDPAPLLFQMDQKDIVSFLEQQGFMVAEPVNLAAERGNEEISWAEFGGDYQ